MKDAVALRMALEQDEQIAGVVAREESRLRSFIRRSVPDPRDVEDILQDVFFRLVEANRMVMPIDHVTAWLFTVARNRIIDMFRRTAPESLTDAGVVTEDGEVLDIAELLPSRDAGPEAMFARNVLLRELELAVAELPREQRDVFVAHELEGRTFRQLSGETGVGVNTLLSRKHYAVVFLRKRLRLIHDELMNS